jgi:HTH-type transcriptional regulator/antitoxin HigA
LKVLQVARRHASIHACVAGHRNRVHEVLKRRRELTLHMIRRLHEGLGIPAESLIKVGLYKSA